MDSTVDGDCLDAISRQPQHGGRKRGKAGRGMTKHKHLTERTGLRGGKRGFGGAR